MNRRGFLGLLGGAAAAVALDPERALWVPGRRLISVPRPSLRYEQVTLNERMVQFLNEGMVQHDFALFDSFGRLAKIGDTIFVRRPARFMPR